MRIRGMPVEEIICHVLMWLLRPLTAPAEVLLHRAVGERFPGVASAVGLMLMEVFGLLADLPSMVHAFMLVVVARIVVVRVLAVLARGQGRPIPSDSSGTPWLCAAFPALPGHVARWAEPFVVLVVGLVAKAVNPALGDYLEFAAVALLATAALRFAVAYGRYLDVVDAEIAARPTPALTGRADADQLDLPWGFPLTATPALANAATDALPVA